MIDPQSPALLSPPPPSVPGPFFCVMVKSVAQRDETLASVSVSPDPCWLLDAAALDELSPPWLREGPGASIKRLAKSVERFGDHCAGAGGKAAPEANVGSQVTVSSEWPTGLLIVAMGLHHETEPEAAERARCAFFKAVLEEIEGLRALGGSLLRRPVIRPWPEAPESARSDWALIAVGAKESASAPWAQEMASALEAQALAESMERSGRQGSRRDSL